ncbi:hypothetical protein BN903_9 [Halorubrum sp. AJ67]|nr:hypothetical protein BN903_9 [Halorubrum sp. AJ67]
MAEHVRIVRRRRIKPLSLRASRAGERRDVRSTRGTTAPRCRLAARRAARSI